MIVFNENKCKELKKIAEKGFPGCHPRIDIKEVGKTVRKLSHSLPEFSKKIDLCNHKNNLR